MAQFAQAGLAIVSGSPLRQFQIPSTCQLPSTAFTSGVAEVIIFRPRPKGSS
jgi:hypothetical protein